MKAGSIFWAGAVVLVAIAGFGAGWLIKGGGSPDFTFDTKAAPYQQADLPGGRSRAGFSGFGDSGGLGGSTIVGGRVSAVGADSVTVVTTSGTSTIRVTGQEKLRLLQPFGQPVVAGSTVFISKKAGTDEAEAVLVLVDP